MSCRAVRRRWCRPAGQDLHAHAGRGGELAGVAGEPGRGDPGRGVAGLAAARSGLRGLLPGALLHDGLDLGDADHVELQGRRAGLLNRVAAVGAGQADQRVDRAHPGPRQRRVQDPGSVDPDRLASGGSHLGKLVHVPAGVDVGAGRKSAASDDRPPRLLRMGADDLAAVVDLHQRPVRAHRDLLPGQPVRHRVERVLRPDMEIALHLGLAPRRHPVRLLGRGQQRRRLHLREHLRGPLAGGAVHPHPRPHPAPVLGAALRVGAGPRTAPRRRS